MTGRSASGVGPSCSAPSPDGLGHPASVPIADPITKDWSSLDAEVVSLVRSLMREALGFNATFADDDIRILAALAQRAVLAGLANDATSDSLARFTISAEKARSDHETALGFPILNVAEMARDWLALDGQAMELSAELSRLKKEARDAEELRAEANKKAIDRLDETNTIKACLSELLSVVHVVLSAYGKRSMVDEMELLRATARRIDTRSAETLGSVEDESLTRRDAP